MPLGIRPINDFAFKKTFGTPENRVCLISLLNAILRPKEPIVDVTLENPFNPQDFRDDKLSVLDIKAVDRAGAIYDVEMQLPTYEGLVQRMVFYGCELYAGQVKSGEDYETVNPVYTSTATTISVDGRSGVVSVYVRCGDRGSQVCCAPTIARIRDESARVCRSPRRRAGFVRSAGGFGER